MTDAKAQLRALQEEREKARERESSLAVAQELADRTAIFELEEQYGHSNVSTNLIPYSGEGVCVVAAVKTPSPAYMKRYRHRVKSGDKGAEPDYAAAAVELGRACLIYPSQEEFDKMCEARPGLDVQMGKLASNLSTGREEAEAKS